MTPLRQKLIDEIQLRGFSVHTQDSYVSSVAALAQFYHRSPDKIVDGDIKAYLLHLLRVRKLAVSSIWISHQSHPGMARVKAPAPRQGSKILPLGMQ